MTNTVVIKAKKIRPLQDWVVLSPMPRAKPKKGALFTPDNPRDFINCEVLAVGPRCELKPGDVVYQQAFVEGEFRFLFNGRKCYMSRERHCNVMLTNPEEALRSA